ncbi:hypothetical protein AXG93_146s1490 [Marchantia polymorpha subsp. ruderalis]|uniref:Uncharacterized protein n=1 Tax=Marchantia polymorpha subsp. ruderalis TaxID=1480154 RepID=A0A176W8X6_MARPO|nr:hypothetical protein AXG93_146s1490 [Marchantia polymorpha subsp. ruderalis]
MKAFRTPKAKPIDEGGASNEGASAEGVGAKELTAEGVRPKAYKMTRSFSLIRMRPSRMLPASLATSPQEASAPKAHRRRHLSKGDVAKVALPTQTTARGLVQLEVVRRREKLERRVAKRRRVVSDDEGDLALEVRRTETKVDVIRQSRTRARPNKRANRELVVAEVSDSSVEKTVAPIVSTPEIVVGESTQPVGREGSLGILIEVLAESMAEPLKEGMEIISPNSLSSERTRTAGSEEYHIRRRARNWRSEAGRRDEDSAGGTKGVSRFFPRLLVG